MAKWTANQLKDILNGQLDRVMHEFDPFGRTLRPNYPERLLGCLRIPIQVMVVLYDQTIR